MLHSYNLILKTFINLLQWNYYISVIGFAKEITSISEEDLDIIMQSRKTFLFHNQEMGKESRWRFWGPMGCYDGVKVCEPEGFFLSNKLWNIFDKESVRLYRDYGFCVLRNLSGPEIERKRKAIVKAFKDCGLRIIIQANLWIVRFCYVQLNFDTSTYQPYRKPDSNPVYLKKISNHPTTILKQLPKSIEKFMLDISSNENVFIQLTPIYQDALQESFCRTIQIHCKW